ncbi:MAG: THUMP domain-containing protein [Candidatus Woesearchaeota archaeon]
MLKCFLLSGENTKLAAAELKSVLEAYSQIIKLKREGRLVIVKTEISKEKMRRIQSRLALTRISGDLLFRCEVHELDSLLKKFDWARIYEQSFAVRVLRINGKNHKRELSEGKIGGLIFEFLKKSGLEPVVNLTNPETDIRIIVQDEKIFCVKVIAEREEGFEKRRQGKLPSRYPVGMHPKLSRCMVNLTGASDSSRVYDPFCGTGGILIEAALIGMKAEGSDIDEDMLKLCAQNLKHLGIRAKIFRLDATQISKPLEYVVSDLPYGKSSKLSEEKEKLYAKFIKVLELRLKGTAVLCINKKDYSMFRERLKRIKIEAVFDHYIHKSLTKRIMVLKAC